MSRPVERILYSQWFGRAVLKPLVLLGKRRPGAPGRWTPSFACWAM